MNFFTSEDLDFQRYCIATHGSIENLIDKAKKGEIVAQAHLGCAYSDGFGDLLPQDNDKAIGWLSTAVENGYESPEILGKLHLRKQSKIGYNTMGNVVIEGNS